MSLSKMKNAIKENFKKDDLNHLSLQEIYQDKQHGHVVCLSSFIKDKVIPKKLTNWIIRKIDKKPLHSSPVSLVYSYIDMNRIIEDEN